MPTTLTSRPDLQHALRKADADAAEMERRAECSELVIARMIKIRDAEEAT